ncbi:ATP-binding cassette domain-containing protein [Microbacterium chocolatum]|uniref:ATP-binding cassette domain-containing protein n=1 Tax=Microbacterium aurantiacum TaxID=162393 RepID=UPI00338F34AC
MSENLLDVTDLVVEYKPKKFRAKPNRVLHGVSLGVPTGKTLGLVGESGSGKTTIGRAILGLAPVTSGSIRFDGREISKLGRRARQGMSGDLQVIFQDPYTSLNPAMEIGAILAEPLGARGVSRGDAQRRIAGLLDRVGLPADSANRMPNEFSGGQRQRVAIARALALDPRLIVCDEPVSALDLTTQARVLDLLLEIQRDTGVSYLFISHDLDVVHHVSHEVAVLYRGDIVEHGPAAQVTREPRHPYTQRLLLASPVPDPEQQRERRAQRHALAAAENSAA